MLLDDDVGGEHDHSRLDRPDVQVMYVLDAGDRLHGCGHMRCADAWWCRFQQDLHRFFKNGPGSSENDSDDQ